MKHNPQKLLWSLIYKLSTALLYMSIENLSSLGNLLFFSLNKIDLHIQGPLLLIVSWT